MNGIMEYSGEKPLHVDNLRSRLERMSDSELEAFGRAAKWEKT